MTTACDISGVNTCTAASTLTRLGEQLNLNRWQGCYIAAGRSSHRGDVSHAHHLHLACTKVKGLLQQRFVLRGRLLPEVARRCSESVEADFDGCYICVASLGRVTLPAPPGLRAGGSLQVRLSEHVLGRLRCYTRPCAVAAANQTSWLSRGIVGHL